MLNIAVMSLAGKLAEVPLQGVTIRAPLLLPALAVGLMASCQISCNLNLSSGLLDITSSSGPGVTTHLRAQHMARCHGVLPSNTASLERLVQRRVLIVLQGMDAQGSIEAASATAHLAIGTARSSEGYTVHPAALDSGLQLGAAVPANSQSAERVRTTL